MAPTKLTPCTQSLPPILYIIYQNPVSSYSKAPWGLSVLSQVTSIFTSTTISPGTLLRQLPNHYAFRAGQNLPDKEFRYLRTVQIITPFVRVRTYLTRNFATLGPLQLRPPFTGALVLSFGLLLTLSLNLPALGRRQLLYFIFRFCRNLCFC